MGDDENYFHFSPVCTKIGCDKAIITENAKGKEGRVA